MPGHPTRRQRVRRSGQSLPQPLHKGARAGKSSAQSEFVDFRSTTEVLILGLWWLEWNDEAEYLVLSHAGGVRAYPLASPGPGIRHGDPATDAESAQDPWLQEDPGAKHEELRVLEARRNRKTLYRGPTWINSISTGRGAGSLSHDDTSGFCVTTLSSEANAITGNPDSMGSRDGCGCWRDK